MLSATNNKGRISFSAKNTMLMVTFFLACMVPRYIGTFKVRIGINFSLYDFSVILIWILYAKKKVIKLSYYFLFYVYWLLAVIASVWRTEAINLWAYYFLYIFITLLFMQMLITNYTGNTIKIFSIAMVTALAVHLLIGIYEIAFHRYLFAVGSFSARYYGKVAVSIFHNPNDYSAFVVTMFPFSVFLAASYKFGLKKIICAAASIVSVFIAIVNESRMAVISMILMLLVYLFISTRKSRFRPVIYIGVIIAATILSMIPPVRFWALRVMQDNTVDLSSRGDIYRVNLIKNGLYFLKKTYGFGVGAGNLYTWFDKRAIYPIGYLKYMHNWYVELLATFGVVFAVAYSIFHIKVFICFLNNSIKERKLFGIETALLLSFISFSLMSISSSTNVFSEWAWMYLGLCGVYCIFGFRKK